METIKASNYLSHTGHDFSDYHIQTAERIYSLIAEGNLKELGELINSIRSLDEKYFVHMTFLDKYGFGFEKKIHKMTKDFSELKRCGLV
jgi:hypothetical protein